MSDSEDDFMSDKYLVEAPTTSKTYSQRRSHAALKAERKVRADNAAPRREEEAARRHAGLTTSLFDKQAQAEAGGSGQAKAMGLMMKMGWKVGEGLGRRRSASPERPTAAGGGGYDDDAPRSGLGARKQEAKAEPIRISMWAGESRRWHWHGGGLTDNRSQRTRRTQSLTTTTAEPAPHEPRLSRPGATRSAGKGRRGVSRSEGRGFGGQEG